MEAKEIGLLLQEHPEFVYGISPEESLRLQRLVKHHTKKKFLIFDCLVGHVIVVNLERTRAIRFIHESRECEYTVAANNRKNQTFRVYMQGGFGEIDIRPTKELRSVLEELDNYNEYESRYITFEDKTKGTILVRADNINLISIPADLVGSEE